RRRAGRRDAGGRGGRESIAAGRARLALRGRSGCSGRSVVAATVAAERPRLDRVRFGRALRRFGWTIAVYALFATVMVVTIAIKPDYGSGERDTLTLAALPLAFAAASQAMVVLRGGTDRSVGALTALANVLARRSAHAQDRTYALLRG